MTDQIDRDVYLHSTTAANARSIQREGLRPRSFVTSNLYTARLYAAQAVLAELAGHRNATADGIAAAPDGHVVEVDFGVDELDRVKVCPGWYVASGGCEPSRVLGVRRVDVRPLLKPIPPPLLALVAVLWNAWDTGDVATLRRGSAAVMAMAERSAPVEAGIVLNALRWGPWKAWEREH